MAIPTKFKNRAIWQAYQTIFSMPEGRIVLRDLCRAHHVFDGGFDPDPYINAFQSGEKNVVCRVLTTLKMTPEDVIALDEED